MSIVTQLRNRFFAWYKKIVYVSSAYTASGYNDGHTWGVDAFSDFSTAKNASPAKIIGCTGEGYTQSETTILEGIETVLQGGGTYTGGIISGDRLASGTASATKNTNLTISNGTYRNSVFGGGYAGNSLGVSLTQNGTTKLTISGGVFENVVAGGMYAYNGSISPDAKVTLDAGTASNTAVKFTISGGTFKGRIYGGNYASNDKATAANSVISGNVSIVIDSSENIVNILSSLNAGSRGTGKIDGDTEVTLTGIASNLRIDSMSGGGSGDTYNRNTHVTNTAVTGSRNLVFNAFNGTISARLFIFSSIFLRNGSNIVCTNENNTCGAVKNWHFDFGTSYAGLTADNTFLEASMRLEGIPDDLTDWMFLSCAPGAVINGFAGMANVLVNGETASFIDGEWITAKFAISTDGVSMSARRLV